MRRKGLKGRTVILKIRLEGFETFTRSHTSTTFIDDADSLRAIAPEQFRRFDRKGKRVRLVGIGVSQLNTLGGEQLALFGEEDAPKSTKIDALLDELKQKYGEKSITRASFLGKADREGPPRD